MIDLRKGKRLIAETRLVRYETRVERAIKAALRKREDLVVESVTKSLTAAGPMDPFSGDTWPDQLASELEPALEDVLEDVKGDLQKRTGARSTATIDITGQLDRMIGKMESLGPDTARRLEKTIAEGIQQGDSLSTVRKQIREVFKMAERQAATIARTETAMAVSGFSHESAMALHTSGTPLWKQWLATDDSRTRPTHNEADNQERPLDQPFDVGGAAMMHPHDPAGPAKENVNCRCSSTYSTEPTINEGE